MTSASVQAPGSIGNVGPGFDILGLAFGGLSDEIRSSLSDSDQVIVTGRDAESVPTKPQENCAWIAARAMAKLLGNSSPLKIEIDRKLPLAGGLGASAASSVGGALATAYAIGKEPTRQQVLEAALCGEEAVAGRHLDNVAPCYLGGLTLVVGDADAPRIEAIEIKSGWWITLVTPEVKVETKKARECLPTTIDREICFAQMGRTVGLVRALAHGDGELLRRCLVDEFAEPHRRHLIPRFGEVKAAALAEENVFGMGISGAGPSLFAICTDEQAASQCAKRMQAAFADIACTTHQAPIRAEGAKRHG